MIRSLLSPAKGSAAVLIDIYIEETPMILGAKLPCNERGRWGLGTGSV